MVLFSPVGFDYIINFWCILVSNRGAWFRTKSGVCSDEDYGYMYFKNTRNVSCTANVTDENHIVIIISTLVDQTYLQLTRQRR